MEMWLAWARGPIFWFAVAFMVLGLIRYLVLTCWETCRAYYRAGDKTMPYKQIARATSQWVFPLYKIKERFPYGLTTVTFHVSIILTPLLLGGHIVLVQRGTGLWWPAIPNIVADVLTVIAILACIALIAQRTVRPDSRAISTFSDYAILLAIAAPFVSGFLVMHPALNPFPYEATLFGHVMSANLIMILIPITKISHCILTPASQLVAEMAWHWPQNAGSKVAVTLSKENEAV